MSERLAASRRIGDIPRHWARLTPEAPALWENGQATSFAELVERISAARELLLARQVRPGDRVMLVAENCVAYVALIFAVTELSAWPVILSARLSARELQVIRDHCQPRLEVFTVGVSADATRHAASADARIYGAAGRFQLALTPTKAGSVAEPDPIAQQVAALIYTSGTTGQPKGVMVPHLGLLHFCRVSSQSRALGPVDRVYAVLPMSHIFGFATQLLATLYGGASLWLERAFVPQAACAALAENGISILQGVSTLFVRLLAHLAASGCTSVHFPRLRYAYAGGGPLDPTLKRDFEATFGLPLHHGYGMTEYAGSMFITRMARPRKDCSCGEINEGCEVRLIGPDGMASGRGQPGNIEVRGPGVMLGYYRDLRLTQETLTQDGWLRTGDIGRIELDGALFIVGRSKDLIIRSGFNVYPIEVESVLASHPAVHMAAVVGRPVAGGDEEVVAFVELRRGARFSEQELRGFLRERLAPYKCPGDIVVLDALPVTANGKIRKQDLRQAFGG